MISYNLIEIIQKFVNSELSVDELEDWLIPQLHLLIKDPDSDNSALVAVIELGLSELSAGVLDLEEFKSSLKNELKNVTALFISTSSDITFSTGSNNQTHNFDRSYVSQYISVSM